MLCLAPFWEVTGKNPTYVLFFFFLETQIKAEDETQQEWSGSPDDNTLARISEYLYVETLVSRNTCMYLRVLLYRGKYIFV